MDGEKVGAMKTIKFEWDGNKAGYTATPVACGWAGAVLRSISNLGIARD